MVEKVKIQRAQVANMVDRWAQEAGLVLIDPTFEWTLSKENIISQGKNTPLINQQAIGKVVKTFTA